MFVYIDDFTGLFSYRLPCNLAHFSINTVCIVYVEMIITDFVFHITKEKQSFIVFRALGIKVWVDIA